MTRDGGGRVRRVVGRGRGRGAGGRRGRRDEAHAHRGRMAGQLRHQQRRGRRGGRRERTGAVILIQPVGYHSRLVGRTTAQVERARLCRAEVAEAATPIVRWRVVHVLHLVTLAVAQLFVLFVVPAPSFSQFHRTCRA